MLVSEIHQLRRVNKFYKKHKTNVSCQQTDKVSFIEINNEIVAAGLIRTYNKNSRSFLLLRSLFVCPNHRMNGLGKSTTNDLINDSTKPIWLTCEKSVVKLYGSLGFMITSTIPAELPNSSKQHLTKGHILMTYKSLKNKV